MPNFLENSLHTWHQKAGTTIVMVFSPKRSSSPTWAGYLHTGFARKHLFLNMVVTVPVNLEYNVWFTIIDPNQQSETKLISLHDHLIQKSWFLCIESVTCNKCLIVTTQLNLPKARAWIDANLEQMVCKSIPAGIDPPPSLLPPWQLDKPVYMTTSYLYADIFKKQFSLTTTTTNSNTANNQPPHKHQATLINYDSNQSADYPPLSTTNIVNSPSSPSTLIAATTTMTTTGYAAESLALKNNINQLKTIIANAVEQITHAIASLQTTNGRVTANAMDMDIENSTNVNAPSAPNNHHHNQLDLPAIIKELKTNIATITQEKWAMFQNYLPPKSNTNTPSSLVTWINVNQCGSS